MSTIMTKKFFIAWIGIFVVWFVGTYVVNGILIDYAPIAHLFRLWEDELKLFPVLIVADLTLTGTFVWFYAQGVESKPWLGQGVRFGLAAALLGVLPMYVRYYVAQPVPEAILMQQLVYFVILMMLMGAIVAFVYRAAQTPARGS